jgi:hypothetical protein
MCTNSEEEKQRGGTRKLNWLMLWTLELDQTETMSPRRRRVLQSSGRSVWKLLHVLVATAAGGVMFGAID